MTPDLAGAPLPPRPPPSRSWLWVCGAMLGVGLPGLLPGRTLAWRDAATLAAPVRGLVNQALRHGHLPLWNPFEGLGKPLFADANHSVLHPISVLCALLVPRLGIDALLVGWLIAAALGAWVLAREEGASGAAAAAAAFAYALSGFVVGAMGLPRALAGASTLPWVIAFGEKGARGSGWGICLLPWAVASLAFSGDFESLAVGLAFVLLSILRRGTRHRGWLAGAALVCGLLLAAPQLWPTWVHVGRTTRSFGVGDQTRGQWALTPFRLPELIAPGLFGGASGETSDPVYRAIDGGSSPLGLPFAASIFFGAPALILAVIGAWRSRPHRWLAFAAIFLLWASLGRRMGAEQLLHAVPIWGKFRYPEKWLGPWTLCCAVLCGVGIDCIVREGIPRWACRAAAVLAIASASIAAALWLFPSGGRELLSAIAGGAAEIARHRLAWGLTLAAVSLVPLLGIGRIRLEAPRLSVTLAALVLAQSLAGLPQAIHLGRAADFLQSRPPPLSAEGPVRVETPDGTGLSSEGADPLARNTRLRGELGYPAFNVAAGLDNIDLYTSLYPIRHEFLWTRLGDARWRAFRRFAATHLLLPAQASLASVPGLALEGADELGVEGEVRVFRLPHRPWAFFPDSAVAIPDRAKSFLEVVDRLAKDDPTVVLQDDRVPPLARGRVLAAERRPESLEIDAESPGPGALVVNDAYWPGWVAEIDGQEVPISPADFLVRAVAFPAGRHTVRFRYDPPEVRWGLFVGVAGFLAWLGLLLGERRRLLPT